LQESTNEQQSTNSIPQSTKIEEYLKAVCQQIRWNKAHQVISEEIENHIIDQKEAFVAEGLDEEAAMDRAIAEMGDPVLVGSELDRTHRPKIEWSIIALTGAILLIGFAVRVFVTYDTGGNWTLANSVIATVLGIASMATAYYLDFTAIGKYAKPIYFSLILILLGTILEALIVNNQYFYSQYLLLLFPTACAAIIYSFRNSGYRGILLCCLSFLAPAVICLLTPNIANIFLYLLNCLILLIFATLKGWFNVNRSKAMLLVFGGSLVSTILIFIVFFLNSAYRMERFFNTVNPSIDPDGAGYLTLLIRELIAKAQFFGPGTLLTDSHAVLPNATTDHILTYLIHRVGWIAFFAVMAVVGIFIIRSFVLSARQKSVLGRLVSTSVLITFTIEVVFYAVSNLGFPFMYSISLPLISHGGTATIINMFLIGIMLSVFKSGYLVRDRVDTSRNGKSKLFEVTDGKIIIHLNSNLSK